MPFLPPASLFATFPTNLLFYTIIMTYSLSSFIINVTIPQRVPVGYACPSGHYSVVLRQYVVVINFSATLPVKLFSCLSV